MRYAFETFASASIFCFSSALNSLYDCRSIFVRQITSGLAWNRGLIELKSSICYSIVYPQVSEMSSRNRMAALRWASAVIAYISIVFR